MKSFKILMAEDDDDDFLLIEKAIRENAPEADLVRVADGVELMEALSGKPAPALILLDLNMPRKDGREALKEIKSSPEWRRIPVVVLTTSGSRDDIQRSYDLHANTYIRKPMMFHELADLVKTLSRYWFKLASSLPS